jgi:hypothetical protein
MLKRGRVDFILLSEGTYSNFLETRDKDDNSLIRMEKYYFNITDYLASGSK